MKVVLIETKDESFQKSYLLRTPEYKDHQFNFSQSWMFDAWFNRILNLPGVVYDREEKRFTIESYSFEEFISKLRNVSFSDKEHFNFSLNFEDREFHVFFFNSAEQKVFIEKRLQLKNKDFI